VSKEIFESSVRSAGDLAGVFEHDGESGYFYLYDMHQSEGHKVSGAIRVMAALPSLEQKDFAVSWSKGEEFVGLFVKDALCAVFDARSREEFGGDYVLGLPPAIPQPILQAFKAVS
jgi:hypothetical protein